MNFRIEKMDEIRIVGKRVRVDVRNASKEIKDYWKKAYKDGLEEKLLRLSNEKPKCKMECLLGVCDEGIIESPSFDYFIGVRYEGGIPDGLEEIKLGASQWAVYADVKNTMKNQSFLDIGGFVLQPELPLVECFYAPGHNPKSELWVAVKPV